MAIVQRRQSQLYRLHRNREDRVKKNLVHGITINPNIGVGDALQYSSLPENYFRTHGRKMVDLSKPWFFDHNPYVIRDFDGKIDKITEMWNFSPVQYAWPRPRKEGPQCYLSNAEIWASLFDAKVFQNRARLYKFEDFPFEQREMILVHLDGRSHGEMPEHIIDHILSKYGKTGKIYQVGITAKDYGIPKIETPTLWDLAEVISKARIFIGVDSGPSWIAACFPDVISKKIRTKPSPEFLENWIPLDIGNIHAHWDSREHLIYNPSEHDIGFTWSYKRI